MSKWMVLEVNAQEKQYRITVQETDVWTDPAPHWSLVGAYKEVDDLMAALGNHLNMEQTK